MPSGPTPDFAREAVTKRACSGRGPLYAVVGSSTECRLRVNLSPSGCPTNVGS